MNGHDIVGGILAVKAAVDTIKLLGGLLPGKRANPSLMPVYRLLPARDADLGRRVPDDAVGNGRCKLDRPRRR